MKDIFLPYKKLEFQFHLMTILFYTVTYMIMIILPIHMRSYGLNNTEIGLVMGLSSLFTTFFRPLAGKVTDRLGPQKILLSILPVFPLLLFGFIIPSLFMFGIAQTLIGTLSAFFSSASGILIIRLSTENKRGKGISLNSLASILPSTFGPAVALYLMELMHVEKIFLNLIIFTVLNVLLLKAMTLQDIWETSCKIKKVEHLDDSVNTTTPHLHWKVPIFIVASLTIMLTCITNGAIFSFLPLYFKEINEPNISLYFLIQTSVLMISRLACAKYIHHCSNRHGKIIMLLSTMSAISTLILSMANNLEWLILAAILNGIAFSSLYPILLTLISFLVPNRSLGLWLSVFIAFADLGVSLGSLIMGFVSEKYSFTTMFQLCSCLSFIAGLLFYCVIKVYQHRRNKSILVPEAGF